MVATDMQRLTGAFLEAFTAQLQPGDQCLVACSGAHVEPLCSVYHKDALPYLEEMRRAGVHAPRALYSRLRTRYVDLADLGYGKDIVANINTRGEYRKLLEENE